MLANLHISFLCILSNVNAETMSIFKNILATFKQNVGTVITTTALECVSEV